MPINNHSNSFSDDATPQDDEDLWYLLSLYVDGEADPEQAAIVERMLNSDPAYRRDFDFLMQSANVLHSVEEIAPPEGLQEAIYAKTTRRPTLVGRLRAAWGGITLPTMGRYAGIGGAFAAAALAVLFLWPHKPVTPSGSVNSSHPAEVAVVAPPHADVPTPVRSEPIIVPTFPVTPNAHPETKQVNNKQQDKKPNLSPDLRKPVEKHNVPVIVKGPTPPKHQTPKSTPTPPTPNDNASTSGGGYVYNASMDQESAQNRKMTIFNAAKDDIGPMVVASHEEPTATTPGSGGTATNPPVTPTPTAATTDTKPRVRIAAALPPDDKQNIAASLIRKNINTKYGGYDRSTMESIQRHEVTIDVIKGSF